MARSDRNDASFVGFGGAFSTACAPATPDSAPIASARLLWIRVLPLGPGQQVIPPGSKTL